MNVSDFKALLASWINPYNENKRMTIDTAQDLKYLLNFNRVMHTGNNYPIFRNHVT